MASTQSRITKPTKPRPRPKAPRAAKPRLVPKESRPTPSLTVRSISREQHEQWAATRTGSFLQLPAWADVKREWTHESLGWFEGDALVGAGLVLYRWIPRLKKALAYLPEGPDVDWLSGRPVDDWLVPLIEHVRAGGAFSLKIGVTVVARTWDNIALKAAVGADVRLRDVPPTHVNEHALGIRDWLLATGWRQRAGATGFGDVQPRYVFQVDLRGQTEPSLLTNMNQLWRRNLKKAEKAGVTVRLGTRADLAAFHEVYVETARRDHFTPRPLPYFQRMWDALGDHLRLYLTEIPGVPKPGAAAIYVRVGTHAWYSYGASTTADRDARPSNAMQWRMMLDALADGAQVYDLRGISDTLDEEDPLFGLIRFKLGTGGEAVELLGEFDYAVQPMLARVFDLYLKRK